MRLLAAMLISQAARRCPLPLCSSSSSSSLKLEPWLAPHEPVDDDVGCVVSHFEAIALHSDLRSRLPPPSAEAVAVDLSGSGSDLTVDLGLKRVVGASITATEIRIDLADGSACDMPWAWLARVAKKQRSGVWEVYRAGVDEAPAKIEGLSELTRRPASLMPLPGAVPPTAVLGGFNMHRVKGLSPAEDTERKLSALGPGARGRVLDVCTGLGYTAIGAARKPAVEEVVTIELDPQMVALQVSCMHACPPPATATVHQLDKLTRMPRPCVLEPPARQPLVRGALRLAYHHASPGRRDGSAAHAARRRVQRVHPRPTRQRSLRRGANRAAEERYSGAPS